MATREGLREVLILNPWFGALPSAMADEILARGLVRHLSDETVYATGDPANGIFALISGEIRIFHTTPEGRSALLMIASPGAWFGEAATIDGQPRSSDAVAVGITSVLQLTPAVFRQIASADSEHWAAFARLVCEQYRRAMEYIVTTANLPAPVRLAQRIAGLAHARGRQNAVGAPIDLRLSQETLAELVGVSRQTLNRALKTLEARGILSVAYRSVTIRDTAALDELAKSRLLPDTLS